MKRYKTIAENEVFINPPKSAEKSLKQKITELRRYDYDSVYEMIWNFEDGEYILLEDVLKLLRE